VSERFADSAARLAGYAGALLGWPATVFWQSTPAELAVVIRALSGEGDGTAAPLASADVARLMEQFPDD